MVPVFHLQKLRPGDLGPPEPGSLSAEGRQPARGESPPRDLPDLLRKVPAALRAVLSAARGTERWAAVPAASPGVIQEGRNRHSGGPPGSVGRGCAGGLGG